MKLTYSFTITFKAYTINSLHLETLRTLVVSGKPIVCKETKYGGIKFSKKYVNTYFGRFHYAAGSYNYPILVPTKRGVVIKVHNFPRYPELEFINDPLGYRKEFFLGNNIISLSDIKEHVKNN